VNALVADVLTGCGERVHGEWYEVYRLRAQPVKYIVIRRPALSVYVRIQLPAWVVGTRGEETSVRTVF